MKRNKKIAIAVIAVATLSLIIFMIPYIVALVDRTPSIPRQQKPSIGELAKSIDFNLVYPTEETLQSDNYNVEYFITCVSDPSGAAFSDPVITGYSIELTPKETNAEFNCIEYRGTHLDREAGRWTLFNEKNYTCLAKDVAYDYGDGVTMYYAEYRPYPSNEQEVAEQKGLAEKSDKKSTDPTFSIFHAYIDVDGMRYSVIYSDLIFSDTLEKECIDKACKYFTTLF